MTDADNLPHTLPYAFRLQRQGADDHELLSAGRQLTEIDDAGTIGVRSDWVGLMADFQVNWPLDQSQSVQWGVVHYRRLAAREGFTPSDIFTPSSDGMVSGKVHAQLEITQTLAPYLRLCQGAPHYLMPPKPAIDLATHFGEHYWLESEHRLTDIPAAVWVSGQASREHPDGVEMELFPAWWPGTDDDIATYFRELFRDGNAPHSAPRPGLISEPLPRPREDGEYRFFLRWPDGRMNTVHTERVPSKLGPTSRFVAALDARGWLTVHRGNPPYWETGSLKAVQDHAGAVFRVPMELGMSNRADLWNPFQRGH
jgi:hypothetical protein